MLLPFHSIHKYIRIRLLQTAH